MQHALKLALVDPRQMRGNSGDDKHVEYRELNKSVGGQNRASLSLEMRHILSDPSVPDDLKMRMYNRTLDRFLNVRDTVKSNSDSLPPIQVTWAPDEMQQQLQPSVKKKKKIKNRNTPVQPLIRKSSRPPRPKRKWLEF